MQTRESRKTSSVYCANPVSARGPQPSGHNMTGREKAEESLLPVKLYNGGYLMNRFSIRKLLSLILIAAMIMTVSAGCGKKPAESANAKEFTLIVADSDGNETSFSITTNKATVGEALFDEGLIKGEDGPYGLYITEVNGIRAVYEEDGSYWAFYINGEYAMSGVDTTEIETGAEYMLKVEAA